MRATLPAVLVVIAAGLMGACAHLGNTEPEAPQQAAIPVPLIPLEERDGYAFAGPWGLRGLLLPPEVSGGPWELSGRFQFDTGGYEVGEPQVSIQQRRPEAVLITLPVVEPPPDAMVSQVITEVPFEASIQASINAQFQLDIQPMTAEE